MNLEQLLVNAAKAAGANEGAARRVAAQLAKEAQGTAEAKALLAALDVGLRQTFRQATPVGLACARAALTGLHALVNDGEDTRASMVRQAEHDAEHEAQSLERYGPGRWRCARCGSQRIDDEHTGRDRMRFMRLLCDACGAIADGVDGDPSLEAWARPAKKGAAGA